MKIGKTTIFVSLIALLIFFGFTFSAAAVQSPEADYERYYPKYVDSKQPLAAIQSKDVQTVRKAEQNLLLQSISSPITMPYGSLAIQQLNIYRLPGERHNPVIFFIHAGDGDKGDVVFAVPVWLSLGYAVVSINHRSGGRILHFLK